MTNHLIASGIIKEEPTYYLRTDGHLICYFIVRNNGEAYKKRIDLYCRCLDKVSTYMSENIHKNDIVLISGTLEKTFDTVKVVVFEIEKIGVNSFGIYDEILELIGEPEDEDGDKRL